MKNTEFYNSISNFYDEMINLDSSVSAKKTLFPYFIQKNYKDAIDLGCGSGADSIALASLGLNVSAFDSSTKMLESAKKNSNSYNFKIKFSFIDLENFKTFNERTDFVISMGNTLANISSKSINKVFKNIFQTLNVGGSFLFQILNYERIINEKERLISITENNDSIYVRFYDFEKATLGFNILAIPKNNLKSTKIFTSTIYPHMKDILVGLLNSAGFSKIKVYGSFKKEKFNSIKSKDLIIHSVR
ncbi:MAG: class I SAM-dependent methyltransferase [Ignavibacteria bacterium]|nr:class I SAM-dependent methyltransferase [Ignavibacteria bacterium]